MGFLEDNLLSLFVHTTGRAGVWGQGKVVDGTQRQRLSMGWGGAQRQGWDEDGAGAQG